MNNNTNKKILKKIKFIFFDFDGVFTNNQVIVSQDGKESVICCRSDGFGLAMLRDLQIPAAIISTEPNPAVKIRAQKLKIACYSNCPNKEQILKKILRQKKITFKDAAYVGNDINDIACMKSVGLAVAVNDAYPAVKKIAQIILKKKGGEGAVREFCEMIYSHQA